MTSQPKEFISDNILEIFKENLSTTIIIKLKSNSIGVQGTKALADALAVNKAVTIIIIKSNRIGTEDAKALTNALAGNNTVTTFSLHYKILVLKVPTC